MSIISKAEAAAEKVFRELESAAGEFDGRALAEARRLLADAAAAESQVFSVVTSYKAEIAALLKQYGPEAAAAAEAEMDKLLSVLQGLFQVG